MALSKKIVPEGGSIGHKVLVDACIALLISETAPPQRQDRIITFTLHKKKLRLQEVNVLHKITWI